jgi:hypothetical protein
MRKTLTTVKQDRLRIAAWISRISLVVFLAVLVLSEGLLAMPGDYWPWYAVMAVFAIVPIVIGPRRYRFFGASALVLSAVLIVSDCIGGKRLQEGQHHVSAGTAAQPNMRIGYKFPSPVSRDLFQLQESR